MQETELDKLDAAPVDGATKLAIEEAMTEYERGEGVTLDQSTLNLRKRLQAWREAKDQTKVAA